MFCIGIDGGGSTLRIGIYGKGQECIYLNELSETVNPCVLGFEKSEELIHSSVLKTIDNSKINPSDIRYIGAGLAGAAQCPDWLKNVLRKLIPNADISVAPDYEIALIGAHGKRFGVLVLSGTGSVAFGVNKSGESFHSGGWGYLMDDGGSGYWLGKESLKSATRAFDGLEEKTPLFYKIFDHLKISSSDDLLTWIYNSDRENIEISNLAPIVLSSAENGDLVAQRIVEDGAEKLYELYISVVRKLKFTNPPVMFAGGILNSDTILRSLLMKKIGLKKVPTPKFSPVAGAALMAKLSINFQTK